MFLIWKTSFFDWHHEFLLLQPGANLIYNTRFSQSNEFLMNKIKIILHFHSSVSLISLMHFTYNYRSQISCKLHFMLTVIRIMLFKTEALDAQSAHLFHTSMMMMKHCSAWTGPGMQLCSAVKNALIIECFINLTSPLATSREHFQNTRSPAWSIGWQKPALGRPSKAAVNCQGWVCGKSLSHAVPCECSSFTKTNSPAQR